MITFPNIKINLGLSITEKRPDGYHNLKLFSIPSLSKTLWKSEPIPKPNRNSRSTSTEWK